MLDNWVREIILKQDKLNSDMARINTTILNRLEDIEKELQKLKIEVFLSLPQIKQKSFYPQKDLLEAVSKTRRTIWQQRYANKV